MSAPRATVVLRRSVVATVTNVAVAVTVQLLEADVICHKVAIESE